MSEKHLPESATSGGPDDRERLVEDLAEALLLLKERDEVVTFLKDLCTPGELSALADRWRIARLLNEGRLSYRQIARETGASTTTVARVARFLRDEPWHGYRTLLNRLSTDHLHD